MRTKRRLKKRDPRSVRETGLTRSFSVNPTGMTSQTMILLPRVQPPQVQHPPILFPHQTPPPPQTHTLCVCVCVCVCLSAYFFFRPKDVYGCPVAPAEFSSTLGGGGWTPWVLGRQLPPPAGASKFCLLSFFCVCAARWEHLIQVALLGVSRRKLLHR